MIINFIIMIPFLIFATVLSQGKGAGLIAGYNTLPDSKKEQYDEKALCKFMAKIMYGISFSLFLWVLSDGLDNQLLFIAGIILFICLLAFGLIYANTGNRFKKK